MKTLSLTARVSLLFAAGAVVVLLGLGWVVERSVEGHFQEMDRHEAEGKLTLLSALFAKAQGPAVRENLGQQLRDALVGHHHLSVAVRGPEGRVWFGHGEAAFPEGLLAGDAAPSWHSWSARGHEYRGLTATLADAGGNAHQVTVAVDISHHRQFMGEFHQALAAATALAALLTAALGWVATRAGLRPLRQVTQLATRLSASSLGERLPEGNVPAEIDALATAFNAMLARLEDAFRRLSDFSSDIAHELRTPLSNLMTQTQVALTRVRSAEEYRDVLASNLEEYERLARMIGDMLFLAQADNSLIAPRREEIDLGREATRLLDFYEALATDSGVHLEAVGTAHAGADRLMLQRALSNLISNAIRHTAAGGVVTVRLGEEAGGAAISIENPGEIPAEHLPRLFDRFYTGDPARRASGEGAGLGLAITQSIVAAHGGCIRVESAGGTTHFRISLPRP